MSTLQENLDRIKKAKSAIKDAIIQKGIDVTDTEKIETYADKILQIKSGGGTEIPEFDPDGPLTIYCFDDWGDAYVKFDNGYQTSTIQYSTDGSTWKTYTDETIKLTKGQYVQFKGVITKYALNTHFSTFILKKGLFNLYGNLTSLDNYISTFDGGYKYIHMFENTNVYDCSMLNTGIKSLKKGSSVFGFMFNKCNYLIKAPALPATTLGNYCYQYMFSDCTSLIKAPALPATTLAQYCYYYMFNNCRGLTTLPSNLLPATTLADYCYSYMFNNCSGLTTIPKLPATSIAQYSYNNMFEYCTSLVKTPDGWYLPAQTLRTNSVSFMFYGCSKLQKMAVAYSGTITSYHWTSFLSGVSKTGTFYYSKNQTKENIQSIVPSGWTLVQSNDW